CYRLNERDRAHSITATRCRVAADLYDGGVPRFPHVRGGRSIWCKSTGTNLLAPLFDFAADLVANRADFPQLLFFAPSNGRRIGKAPVESLRRTGEDRAPFSAGFIANRDDVGKQLA